MKWFLKKKCTVLITCEQNKKRFTSEMIFLGFFFWTDTKHHWYHRVGTIMRSHFYFVRCLFPRSGRCTPRSRQRSSVVLLPLSMFQWKGIIPIILPLFPPPPSSHKKGNIPDNYHTFSHTFLLTYLWGKNP